MTGLLARRLATLVILATVSVGLSGCDSDSGDAKPEVTTNETAAANEPTTEATEEAAPTTEASGDQAEALAAIVEEAQSAIPSLMETFGETYSKIEILGVDGDTFEYAYTYATAVDAAAAAESLDSISDALESAAQDSVIPQLESAGVTNDPKVRYTYYNPDGSLVWSQTYGR